MPKEERNRKVTIKDVAKEAGVSISTVSNALNGVDVLAPETKAHVLEVVERLRYVPNLNGKNLKAKATKAIGLFVTSIKGEYFGVLADTMFKECIKYGYELNIYVTWNKNSNMNNILGGSIDGSVILSDDIEEEELQRIVNYEIPAVFLDRDVADETVSSVVFDSYQDGVLAAEYMLKKDVKQICYVQGVMHNYDGIQRYRGFVDTWEKAGRKLDENYILKGDFDRNTAKESMVKFLAQGYPLPDGIFAANDMSALGCIDALKQQGYRVPQDTIVMGVDDIELAEWYRPTLTTIQTGVAEQARRAIEDLIKLINREQKGEVVKLPGTIVERESTVR